ncbi:hypothetical protein [Burkholderia lata]|nr:hypothetical protein [Burkholderia lata]
MIEQAWRVKRIASDHWRRRLRESGALSTHVGVTNTCGRSAPGLTIDDALPARDRRDGLCFNSKIAHQFHRKAASSGRRNRRCTQQGRGPSRR